MIENNKKHIGSYIVLIALTAVFLYPLFLVLINSFKDQFSILKRAFALPVGELFVGFDNYVTGVMQSDFFRAFGISLFMTVVAVFGIILLTSMTAWYIIRVKTKFTKLIYYAFVFSMIVPFQMVMYSMVWVVAQLGLDNPLGLSFVYVGFGAGLSVFMFAGFIKSIPLEIEEAANVDGCNPIQTFFYVVLPILKPTAITVSILNAMWVWNDYLLPYLVLGTGSNKTLPVAIQQAVKGLYGNVNWGAFMAMLVLAIIPIVVFYVSCQKYIIKGVIAGAVKG